MPPNVSIAGLLPADPFDEFYAIRDKQSPQVKKARRSGTLIWDPWPVTIGHKDALFDAAMKLVRQRNSHCVNICMDKIVLLPASGNLLGLQGGSREFPLYSLRSPEMPPVKFHLWHVAGTKTRRNGQDSYRKKKIDSKVMVRHGQTSEPLKIFLQSFGVLKHEAGEHDLCKHYSCWKSLKLTDKWLSDFPRLLRPRIYERWFSANGFRFLDLPTELREAILMLAIGPVAEPFAGLHYRKSQLPTPTMGLTLVSKQVYNEVMPLLFANAAVYIRTREQFERFFRSACPTLRPRFSEKLRTLVLHMGPHTLLKVFGVLTLDLWEGYHYFQRHTQENDLFTSVCLGSDALKVLKIHIPHIYQLPILSQALCQKAFSAVVWSAAREYLRNIPCVRFGGFVCESQKRKWLEVLDSDRKGVENGTAVELLDWKRQIWDECRTRICKCEPTCFEAATANNYALIRADLRAD